MARHAARAGRADPERSHHQHPQPAPRRHPNPESGFIVRVGDHLRIDPHLTGCDLWRFQAALAAAASALGEQARHAALEQAAGLWRGDLADGIDAVWIEETRETLRRDVVDTLARLAKLREHDNPEQPLAVLERAITVAATRNLCTARS